MDEYSSFGNFPNCGWGFKFPSFLSDRNFSRSKNPMAEPANSPSILCVLCP